MVSEMIANISSEVCYLHPHVHILKNGGYQPVLLDPDVFCGNFAFLETDTSTRQHLTVDPKAR